MQRFYVHINALQQNWMGIIMERKNMNSESVKRTIKV